MAKNPEKVKYFPKNHCESYSFKNFAQSPQSQDTTLCPDLFHSIVLRNIAAATKNYCLHPTFLCTITMDELKKVFTDMFAVQYKKHQSCMMHMKSQFQTLLKKATKCSLKD